MVKVKGFDRAQSAVNYRRYDSPPAARMFCGRFLKWRRGLPKQRNHELKGLSYEIDFENVDEN
jgi:hypothetical protein